MLMKMCAFLELCAAVGIVGFRNHVFLELCLLGIMYAWSCVCWELCVRACKYASIVDGSGPLFYTDP